jgi:hypothetical protein
MDLKGDEKSSIISTKSLPGRNVMKKLSMLGMVGGAALLCAAPVSLHWSPAKQFGWSLDTAQARIGRPLTPMSVAGVNRRMHRRAYYGSYGANYGGYHHPYYAYGRPYYHRGYYRY